MTDEIIIFGVLASIVFHELTQISPGGIIVPGYIALLRERYRRGRDGDDESARGGRRRDA